MHVEMKYDHLGKGLVSKFEGSNYNTNFNHLRSKEFAPQTAGLKEYERVDLCQL